MKKKNWHLFAMILFVVTIILNYLAAFGILFPYSQQEVSDMHANLLAPAGITFSIWGVIYLGALLSLILPWLKKMNSDEEKFYYNQLMPLFCLWTVFNIIWTVTWNNNWILLALIAIIAYTVSLILASDVLAKNLDYQRKYKWFITYPLGLHTGWLTFASFTNIMTLMVKNGFDAFSGAGVTFTVIFLVLATLAVLWVLHRTGNSTVTYPALWALIGLMIKHRSGSDFANSNRVVLIASIVILVLAVIGHVTILKDHKKRV